jgi:hypothetical protein
MSRRRPCWIAGLFAVLQLAGCEVFDRDVRVVYRVEGTAAQVLVVYRTEAGFDTQRTAPLPVQYEGQYLIGHFIGITATSLDAEPRELTCEIRVEGRVVVTDAAEGTGATVTCASTAER